MAGEDRGDWTHLMLPMRHDPDRHCVTVLKVDEKGRETTFEDPRVEDAGELMWPERFGPKRKSPQWRQAWGRTWRQAGCSRCRRQRAAVFFAVTTGSFGRAKNSPSWSLSLPASADTAYTEKEENDPTGFTVWGVFRDKSDRPRAILLWGWEKRCELLGKPLEKLPNETKKAYDIRSMPTWGLVEWIAYSCRRFRVDQLLIENKASGKSVAQAMKRLYAEEGWSVNLVDPAKDKVSRAWTVEPLLAAGLVYAPPEEDAPWVEKILNQCENFSQGRARRLG